VVFGALVFKLSVWCGVEGCVSGLRAASSWLWAQWCPKQGWASNKICNKNHLFHLVGILFLDINDDARSKPHQTYKRCWKWWPRASIQAWTRLILFTNTFCTSACEMLLMYAVTVVFNPLAPEFSFKF
jgi:hypothetical protein